MTLTVSEALLIKELALWKRLALEQSKLLQLDCVAQCYSCNKAKPLRGYGTLDRCCDQVHQIWVTRRA